MQARVFGGQGYTLSHYSEVSMSAPESVPLPRTNAGETADISVNLIAPGAVGTHRSNFVIKNPAGLIMQVDNDSRLWLIINVISVTSTDAGTGDGSGDANINCVTATDAPRTDQILSAINSFRTQNNLAKYTVNAQLALAAQAHANDMACNQLSKHEGSDGSTPQTRVAAAGYAGTDVTENVYGSDPPLNPDQVVNWWKIDPANPNHSKNLNSTQYTEIGIGYASFNNYGAYVAVFATP